MKKAKILGAMAGFLVLGSVSALATDVRQYIVIANPVHMAQYTRNTQELVCPNGDFAIAAGHFFTHADGGIITYPDSYGMPGSDIPILDKDGDGVVGYQINAQNDEPANLLWDYIQCLSLSGQVQEKR